MRTFAGDRAHRWWTGAIASASARRGVLGGVLVLVLVVAACSSDPSTDGEADGEPSPTDVAETSPSSSPSAETSPSPSPELPVSPIPDGRYTVTLTDPADTFFDEAPAKVVLTLDHGEYTLQEKGIQFESGIYWGVDQHIEFDASVGPCSGAESFHEYDWSLRDDELRFESEGGQVCIGRLILFTESIWLPLS